MIEKYYCDGKVGVLYSPGFGAGWSTWCSEHAEFLTFDATLVQFVLEKADREKVQAYVDAVYPGADIYCGGWRNIQVVWMEPGTAFRFTEYDGSEGIEYMGKINYFTA